MCICASQSACSEENPAEITYDYNATVNDSLVPHHIHDRHSGCTGRFAVVTVTHNTGILTDDIGVAVMRRCFVLIPDALEEGKRLFLGFAGSGITDKPAFVDNNLFTGLLSHRDI